MQNNIQSFIAPKNENWVPLNSGIMAYFRGDCVFVDLVDVKVKGLKDTLRLLKVLKELKDGVKNLLFLNLDPSVLTVSRLLGVEDFFELNHDERVAKALYRVA